MKEESDLAWWRSVDISTSIRIINNLIKTKIFERENHSSPLFRAAVTQLLICLSDLLAKANDDDKRVAFTDDVELRKDIGDVTDLISRCRNISCHMSSPLHKLEDHIHFSFNVVSGKNPNAFKVDGNVCGCEFDDDTAIYFGKFRIYLKRNIFLAFNSVRLIYPDQ